MVEDRGTRVYVGNLGEKVKKEDLESEFTKYGKLNSVWVAFNPPGFAFVEFESRNEAEKACEILNGVEALGSGKLRVEISKGRPNKGGRRNDGRGPGGRFGGPGGRFRSGGPGGNGGGGGFRRDSGGFRGGNGGYGRQEGGSGFRSRDGGRNFSSGGNFGSSGGFRSREGGRNFGSGGNFGGRSAGGPGGRFRSRSPRSRF